MTSPFELLNMCTHCKEDWDTFEYYCEFNPYRCSTPCTKPQFRECKYLPLDDKDQRKEGCRMKEIYCKVSETSGKCPPLEIQGTIYLEGMQAGMKKVVDFIEREESGCMDCPTPYLFTRSEWEAFKKEQVIE